jgi:hypothetical protein
MTTGLREFTGWARLKMLSGLREQRNIVKLNDAMVAAEMKKNFGDDFDVPKQEDEVLIGRDFVQPSPQPIVIMPQAPAATPTPQASNSGWIALLAVLAILGFAVWYVEKHSPKDQPKPAPPSVQSGEEYDIKFFRP